MYRALSLLGSSVLLLVACHGGGASTMGPNDPNDPMNPMNYRPIPTLQRRVGPAVATVTRAAVCASPTAQPSAHCDRTR